MSEEYHRRATQNTTTEASTTGSPTLSPQDRRTLEVGSAIAADVIAARGVFSVERGRDLPPEFSRRQRGRGAGILFRVWRPDGSTAWMFRPREADPDRPGLKYEAGCKSRGAPGNTLDVHPYCREWIEDKTVPVVFVEGIKKSDAIISAARAAGERIVVVAISGVWNWLSAGEPIPDMFLIPLEGREVRICFDSDVFINPDVADAARRLAGHAEGRGAARVLLAYLPQAEPERKVGADDYLAAGHSYADLAGCFKPFDPGDLAAERLRRSDLLRERLDDIWHTFWDTEWRGMGGHTDRDLYKVLCDLAGDRGRLHPDGLRVKVSRRELAELVRVSSRTLQKAIERLEGEGLGLIYRDNSGRKVENRGAFVLVRKAPSTQSDNVNHEGQGTDTEQKESKSLQGVHAGGLHRRFAPTARRLQWSTPGRRARRGTVPGTRRVRDNITPAREAVKRFGKIRGAILDALEAFGGSATLAEVCGVLHRENPRELVRFRRSAKGKDGVVVMLMEAGLVEWVSDVAARREVLRLADDWASRLAEIDDLESDRLRRREWHDRDRENFRAYRKRAHRAAAKPRTLSATKPARPADGYISDLAREEPPLSDPAKSDLAKTVADYLEFNSAAVREHGARVLPGWLAGTLWAYDLYPVKVSAADVSRAIGELGVDPAIPHQHGRSYHRRGWRGG